jgi:hypothetical protein
MLFCTKSDFQYAHEESTGLHVDSEKRLSWTRGSATDCQVGQHLTVCDGEIVRGVER